MTGSVLVLRPKEVKPSRVKVGGYTLLAFVFLQPFMYGQARDAMKRKRVLVSQLASERTRIQLYSRRAVSTLHNTASPP